MSNEEQDLNILFQEISSIISRNIYNVTGGILRMISHEFFYEIYLYIYEYLYIIKFNSYNDIHICINNDIINLLIFIFLY